MKKPFSVLIAAVMLCGLLAGCGSTEKPTSGSSTPPSEATSTPEAAVYPVTIENNGVTATYEKAPERVVVLDYPSAEIISALGLSDKVVALAPAMNLIDEVLDIYRADIAAMPLFPDSGMTNGVPNLETVLSVTPDLAIGTSYSFIEQSAGAKEDYIANKINMYAMEGTYVENPTLENLYNDIMNIGRIFGVEDKATALIDGLRAREAAVLSAVSGLDPVPVFVYDYDMGEGVMLSIGGVSYEDALIVAAGGKNVFGDMGKDYTNVSLEEVISRGAECVIVTSYYKPDDGQSKVDYMKKTTELSGISAVKNDRFIIVSGIATFPSLQNLDVLETIAKGLHPEKFQ